MPQQVETKVPLADFARNMGIHPLHFAGVQVVTPDDSTQQVHCDTAWMQHEWQASDGVSREEVARAIQQAEDDIEAYLGFRLMPAWEVDEWQPGARYFRPEMVNLSARDIRGLGQLTQSKWGHFISGGIRQKTLIEATSAIAYSSSKPPALYEDLATVTVLTSVTDPAEIAVYYPGKAGDEEFRIRPIDVTITTAGGGTAVITFARELVVIESLLEDIFAGAIDGTDDPSFLTTVDVYRVYNDPQTQVSFLWEAVPNCGTCNGGGCVNCQYTTQTGCLLVRNDPRLGMVVFHPGDWNTTTLEFDGTPYAVGRTPDLTRLYYYSGLRDKGLASPNAAMSLDWARTVCILAASRIDRAPCDCSTRWWDRWAADMAFVGGADETGSYRLSASDLDNPIGTRRGEVYAWRRISRRGMAIGRSAAPMGA